MSCQILYVYSSHFQQFRIRCCTISEIIIYLEFMVLLVTFLLIPYSLKSKHLHEPPNANRLCYNWLTNLSSWLLLCNILPMSYNPAIARNWFSVITWRFIHDSKDPYASAVMNLKYSRSSSYTINFAAASLLYMIIGCTCSHLRKSHASYILSEYVNISCCYV